MVANDTIAKHDCQAELASAREAFGGRKSVDRRLFRYALRHDCLFVRWIAFERFVGLRPSAQDWFALNNAIHRLLLDELVRPDPPTCRIQRDDALGEEVPSRFEVGDYVGRYLLMLATTDRFDDAADFATELGSRLKIARSHDANEATLLGGLEHIVHDPSVVDAMSGWRDDPYLRPLLEEAIRLSKGFERPSRPGESSDESKA